MWSSRPTCEGTAASPSASDAGGLAVGLAAACTVRSSATAVCLVWRSFGLKGHPSRLQTHLSVGWGERLLCCRSVWTVLQKERFDWWGNGNLYTDKGSPAWLQASGSFHIKRQLRDTEGQGTEINYSDGSFFSEEINSNGRGWKLVRDFSFERRVGECLSSIGICLSMSITCLSINLCLYTSRPSSCLFIGLMIYFTCHHSPCVKYDSS